MTVIIVEGDADKAFLEYLLSEKLKLNDYEIMKNGTHGISEGTLTKLKKYFANGHDIILINDQDDVFDDRKKDACEQLNKIYIDIPEDEICKKIFLLPSNIKEKGKHLEDLLFSCVPEHKKYIVECYETMRECLKTNPDSKMLTIPDHHNQAYVFAGIHLTDEQQKLRNKKDLHPYAFFRIDIWDYESKEIKPLLNFLENNVK